MGTLIDRVGQRFGRLVVVARASTGPASRGRRVKWCCLCDCGNTKVATGHELAAGQTTSCGCYKREVTGERARSHGWTRTPTYGSWGAAKRRCHDPKVAGYARYGARGIFMCDRWRESFAAFLEDMGPRPDGTTLDRIDQTKGYEPGNVRWATTKQQTENRGNMRAHRWRGKWMTRREIAMMEGLPYTSLVKAIKKTRTIQDAVAHVIARRGRTGLQNLRPAT